MTEPEIIVLGVTSVAIIGTGVIWSQWLYQKRRAEVWKAECEKWLGEAVSLSRDRAKWKAKYEQASSQQGFMTREANRFGNDVYALNKQIADLKHSIKVLQDENYKLSKRVPRGCSGI